MKTKSILFLALASVFMGFFNMSCSSEDKLQSIDDNEILSSEFVINEPMAQLHSMALSCAFEIASEQQFANDNTDMDALAYAVTESAILKAVQQYVAQEEGRNLTSTEKNTLKLEVNSYWTDSTNRNLTKKIAQPNVFTNISPTIGCPELNQLYRNFGISAEVQQYFNRMLANLGTTNYEYYLDRLYGEVWQNGYSFSPQEKEALLKSIAVTKDSYKYWNTQISPMTRISGNVKSVIIGDVLGALRGLWKGIVRSSGGLVFGPGGAVLTIAGSVVVDAAVSSVEAGIAAGLIRAFW